MASRFDWLHSTYRRQLREYIAARLGRHAADVELVKDLMQETWLEVWRQAGDRGLPRVGSDFGWLAATARRVIITHFRRARAEVTVFALQDLADRHREVAA
ncbi:RNA polymerase sigma factor [Streptomyces sp. TR06-5]|uniref:RNA polymerase sigma factor n=1 Tax=Streptomyces sp. TR06-5 TaxID=3385976 RepID=UPI00399F7244